MRVKARSVFVLAAVLMACGVVHGMGLNKDPRKKVPPRNEDVPLILCDACHHLSERLYSLGEEKMDEDNLIDEIEKSTTAWRTQGEWMTKLHLEGKGGGTLWIKNMKKLGECGVACKTIEKAMRSVMGEHDTDVAEALYMGKFKSKKAFDKWLCEDLAKVCPYKGPKLPKDHIPYPAFERKDANDQNIERVLGEMADQGLKGNIFSREEMLEKYMSEMGDDMPNMPDEL